MATLHLDLGSLDDTGALAGALARVLRAGDVVLLSGELGAGKTTLVREIATAMGVPPVAVSSPTFTVVHEHHPPAGPFIVHADAYRLRGDDEEELLRLGWDRVLAGEAVALIEWGERIASLIDRPLARLTLAHAGPTQRSVTLDAPDDWTARPGWRALRALATGSVFDSDRDQWADLHRWMSGAYRLSRPMDNADAADDSR